MNSDITKYGLIGVSVERSFGFHSAEPFCAQLRDRLPRTAAPSRALPFSGPTASISCAQHELRVAEDRKLGVVRLVEVARVVGRVDDALARRDDRRRDVVLRSARCRSRRSGRFVEEMDAAAGIDDSARAERERMVFGKARSCRRSWSSPGSRAARRARRARRRFRVEHALPGADHRATRVDQHLGRVVDVVAESACARRSSPACSSTRPRSNSALTTSIGHLDHAPAPAGRSSAR